MKGPHEDIKPVLCVGGCLEVLMWEPSIFQASCGVQHAKYWTHAIILNDFYSELQLGSRVDVRTGA